ncbi:MAG: hypothetical protein RMJ13_05440 [Elusimicrobiota bacterium]|nr:hypothetical protein [Elusimicrobiota bacterium]
MLPLPLNNTTFETFSNVWRKWEDFCDSVVYHHLSVPEIICQNNKQFFSPEFLWYVVVLKEVYYWFMGIQYNVENYYDYISNIISSTINLFQTTTCGENQQFNEFISLFKKLVELLKEHTIAKEFAQNSLWRKELNLPYEEIYKYKYNLIFGKVTLEQFFQQGNHNIINFQPQIIESLVTKLSSSELHLTPQQVVKIYRNAENMSIPDRIRRALFTGGYFNLLLFSQHQQDIEEFYKIFSEPTIYNSLGKNREVLYYLDGIKDVLQTKLNRQQLHSICETVIQQLEQGDNDPEISAFIQQFYDSSRTHIQDFFESLNTTDLSKTQIATLYHMIIGWIAALHPIRIEENFVQGLKNINKTDTFIENFNLVVKTSIDLYKQKLRNQDIFGSEQFLFCWFLLKSYTKLLVEELYENR